MTIQEKDKVAEKVESGCCASQAADDKKVVDVKIASAAELEQKKVLEAKLAAKKEHGGGCCGGA